MAAIFYHLANLGLLVILAISSVSSLSNGILLRRNGEDGLVSRSGSNQQTSSSNNEQVVMGKFMAPAPDRLYKQRIPKGSEFGSRTMSASFRVADESGSNNPEKVVHGIIGASAGGRLPKQHTVSAKMQVSDEGLNYPPSKLSADIYGNVAEIVTAPPEAVENDFLLPISKYHISPPKRSSN